MLKIHVANYFSKRLAFRDIFVLPENRDCFFLEENKD